LVPFISFLNEAFAFWVAIGSKEGKSNTKGQPDARIIPHMQGLEKDRTPNGEL